MSLLREVELVLDYCVRTMLTEWKELRSKPGFSVDEPIDKPTIAPELTATTDAFRQYLTQTPASTVIGILNTKVQAGKRPRGTPRPTVISAAFCVEAARPPSLAIMITTHTPNQIAWGSTCLRISADSLVYQLSPSFFGRVEVSPTAFRVWVVDEKALMRRTAQRLEAEAIVRNNWSRLAGSEVQERLKDMVTLRGLGRTTIPAYQRDDALAHLQGRNVRGVTSFVAAAIAMNLKLRDILSEP